MQISCPSTVKQIWLCTAASLDEELAADLG
jgi:hypothetical protein